MHTYRGDTVDADLQSSSANSQQLKAGAPNIVGNSTTPTLPPAESRTVEITIRDSHRPMQIFRATQFQLDSGAWSRFTIEGLRHRPVGRRGLALLLAEALL